MKICDKTAASNSDLSCFDLLPDRFRLNRQLQTIRYAWMTLLGALLAAIVGTTVAESIQHRLETHRRNQLIAEAFPIVLMRQQIQEKTATQTSEKTLIQAVESAKPNDELLQLLARIAIQTPIDDHSIEIKSLRIQLPLEYKRQSGLSDQAAPPTWAVGSLRLSATANSPAVARQWAKQIRSIERIDEEYFQEEVPFQNTQVDDRMSSSGSHARQPVTITAVPLSEVRIP